MAIRLSVAPVAESVNVNDSRQALLDTTNTANTYQLGRLRCGDWAATAPGRQAIDVVQSQPGWVLEANGVVHPRGSEITRNMLATDFQGVQNRSPAFSPSDDLDDVQSVKTYTSGIRPSMGGSSEAWSKPLRTAIRLVDCMAWPSLAEVVSTRWTGTLGRVILMAATSSAES